MSLLDGIETLDRWPDKVRTDADQLDRPVAGRAKSGLPLCRSKPMQNGFGMDGH